MNEKPRAHVGENKQAKTRQPIAAPEACSDKEADLVALKAKASTGEKHGPRMASIVLWTAGILVAAAVLALMLRTPPETPRQKALRDRGEPPPAGQSSLQALSTAIEPSAQVAAPTPEVDYPPGFRPMKPRPFRSAKGTVVTGPDGKVQTTAEEETEPGLTASDFDVLKIGQDRTVIRKKENRPGETPRPPVALLGAANAPAMARAPAVADAPTTR